MKTTVCLAALVFLWSIPCMAPAAPEDRGGWEFTIEGGGRSHLDFRPSEPDGRLDFDARRQLGQGFGQGLLLMDRSGAENRSGYTRFFFDYNFNLIGLRPFIGLNGGYLFGGDTNDRWVAGPQAGVQLFLIPRTFLFLMGEYQLSFQKPDQIDDLYNRGNFIYTLRLGINW